MARHVAPAAAGLPRGAIYVDTHVGVLARLDAESGELDWGYGYQTEPVQSQSRFFFFYGSAAGADGRQQPRRSGRRGAAGQGGASRTGSAPSIPTG